MSKKFYFFLFRGLVLIGVINFLAYFLVNNFEDLYRNNITILFIGLATTFYVSYLLVGNIMILKSESKKGKEEPEDYANS